jgi:hypothetical protein
MKTRRTLLPGQPGTKKFVVQYGDELVCVRYRYDAARKLKLKTVEIIVEQSPWQPNSRRIPGNKRVPIRITYGERNLGTRVKAAGGRWNKHQKVWELAYKKVVELGLLDRIVEEAHEVQTV